MAILIDNMEMPKDCPQCPMAHWNRSGSLTGCNLVWRFVPDTESEYWQSSERPSWCPLVEITDKVNRMIVEAVLSGVAEAIRGSIVQKKGEGAGSGEQ